MSNGWASLLPGMEPIKYEDLRGHEIWFMLQRSTFHSEDFIDIHVCDLSGAVEDDAGEFFSMPRDVAVKIAEAIMLSENESAGTR